MTDSATASGREDTPVSTHKDASEHTPVEQLFAEAEHTIVFPDDTELFSEVWLRESASGRWHKVDAYPFLIGRGENCNLTLRDRGVSREHARIIQMDGAYAIEDTGSSNGLRINGHRLSRAVLAENDVLKVGKSVLHFHYERTAVDVPQHKAAPTGKTQAQARVGKVTAQFAKIDLAKISRPQRFALAGGALLTAVAASGFSYRSMVEQRVVPIGTVGQDATVAQTTTAPTDPAKPTSPDSKASSPAQTTPKVDATAANITPVASADPTNTIVALPPGADRAAAMTAMIAPPSDDAIPPEDRPWRLHTRAGGTLSQPTANDGEPVLIVQEPVVSMVATPDGARPASTSVQKTKAPSSAGKPEISKQKPTATKKQSNKSKRSEKRKTAAKAQKNRTAKSTVNDALSTYRTGNGKAALSALKDIATSTRVDAATRDAAAQAADTMEAALADYTRGEQALAREDQAQAFAAWGEFLDNDKRLVGNEQSTYAKTIRGHVADEYLRRAKRAQDAGQTSEAYRLFEKATQIKPGGTAERRLDEQRNTARDLYQQAYKLETASLDRALELWRQVVSITPPGSEYHTKANAKLKWYASRG